MSEKKGRPGLGKQYTSAFIILVVVTPHWVACDTFPCHPYPPWSSTGAALFFCSIEGQPEAPTEKCGRAGGQGQKGPGEGHSKRKGYKVMWKTKTAEDD